MGLFNRQKEGGIMDAIRCDQKDFLIWKWRPGDQEVGASRKENVIRNGSSLSVRPGQAAIFLYQNNGGYEVIFGPYNNKISTENLPILASIVGLAYAGGSPVPAELYFIDLAKNMEIPFLLPFFRIVPAEPEFKTYDIRVAVKGTIAFEVPTNPEYIKYLFEAWGGSDTTLEELENKMKALIAQEVQQIIANVAKETGVFVLHLNSLIGEIGKYILNKIQQRIANRFGILATDVILSFINYNEDSESYQRLKHITEDQSHLFNLEKEKNALLAFEIQRETMRTDANVRNATVQKTAEINLEHQKDILSRMRDEGQFAQHEQTLSAAMQANLASQSGYINAHALNRQADVLQSGLGSLGEMSQVNLGGSDAGVNPAGMMTGMMMGGAMANQMGQMMGQMGNAVNQSTPPPTSSPTPPPLPSSVTPVYYLAINGQQYGPSDINSIVQLIKLGQVTPQTLVWCEGMPSWTPAASIPSLASLFVQSPSQGQTPPPIPPIK